MWLAGIPVPDTAVVELIDRLHAAELDRHADHLQRTLGRGARIVALDSPIGTPSCAFSRTAPASSSSSVPRSFRKRPGVCERASSP